MKIKLLSGIIVLALMGAGYFLFQGQEQVAPAQAQKQQAPAPTEVMVHTVKYEEIIFTKALSGRTSAYQIAEIRPQVSGIVLNRLFTEGSVVEKGQQLYQIDPATYQAAHARAAAGLSQARADLAAIEPKVKRYARLVTLGGVSHQAHDDVVASLAQANAAVIVAKANVATAKINLDYTRVFAPISGRIGRSLVTEGALVTADQATAMATIQNLSQIYVDVNQSSSEMMKLRNLMKTQTQNPEAVLLINDEDDIYAGKGKILFSDVTVDQGTGMVQLRILFPNPDDELLPGLFVRARIEQSRQDNAITIPQQAVVRNADGSIMVWTVDQEGRVNTRPIMVSRIIKDKWLVTSGLKPGDKVVVEGLQKIHPMAKVTIVEMLPSNS
ncbi:MAG: efflux RND transporter periplasmic adaptor subunit [Proteobacteria bacterium]|nr:efflux RND transporter periplasmic adaptor subunit [Desulfobacula sp.]MBU3954560.1 efflux RND transporter periplasmic adaptor subunit [Pseudomonadota bacterium]MBU4130020.1 efflux RND transporter periplasmic adaptor subunit [Pseudomonadota bacterium]